MPGTLPIEPRCALWVSVPGITALGARRAVASVSGESGVPLSPACTRPRLADASPPAAGWRGLDAFGGSAAMYRRQSLRLVSAAHRRLRFASIVASACARGAVAPRTGAGELHHQCFANISQCAGAQSWCRLAGASCWISLRLRLGLAPWCSWHLWRTPATAKLHNAALPSVSASQSQAPFVAATASRPAGEGNRRYAKLPSLERSHGRRRSPVAAAPYAPPAVRPWGRGGTVASIRRCARCFGQWPAASHLVCAPAHPPGPRRCAALAPARRSARPPPKGAPSVRREVQRRQWLQWSLPVWLTVWLNQMNLG